MQDSTDAVRWPFPAIRPEFWPELQGCLSQGDSLDELMKNIKEAIELCLEVEAQEKQTVKEEQIKFVGVQEITV